MYRRLAFITLLFCSAPSFAIYKCETAEGISYSDQPCHGGTLLKVSPSGEASPAQRRATSAERRRRREDSAAEDERPQKRLRKTASVHDKRCRTLALRQKWAEEDAAAAAGRDRNGALQKARRAKELHEAECASGATRTMGIG